MWVTLWNGALLQTSNGNDSLVYKTAVYYTNPNFWDKDLDITVFVPSPIPSFSMLHKEKVGETWGGGQPYNAVQVSCLAGVVRPALQCCSGQLSSWSSEASPTVLAGQLSSWSSEASPGQLSSWSSEATQPHCVLCLLVAGVVKCAVVDVTKVKSLGKGHLGTSTAGALH